MVLGPRFYESISSDAVEYREGVGFGMIRTEITYSSRGSYLGYVFDDAPRLQEKVTA